jgi:hypothetical protein
VVLFYDCGIDDDVAAGILSFLFLFWRDSFAVEQRDSEG